MFDNNPFRAYKQMIKKKRLSENTREIAPGGGGTTREADTGTNPLGIIPRREPEQGGLGPTGFNLPPNPKPTKNADKVHDILTNPDSTPEDLDAAARILRAGSETGRTESGGIIYSYDNAHLHREYLPMLRNHPSYDRKRHYV